MILFRLLELIDASKCPLATSVGFLMSVGFLLVVFFVMHVVSQVFSSTVSYHPNTK